MKDMQLWALDVQNTLQAVRSNPDGVLLTALDSSDITVTAASAGDTANDDADTGNPMKVGGVARSANPTKVANGDRVNSSFDLRGRQIVTFQARELVATAYVSISNGTETTLKSGESGVFLDLVSITGANTSTAAIGAGTSADIDIRDTLTGGIVASLSLQDQDSHTVHFNPPLPQNEAGNSWTVDMNDLTGTTVNLTAVFIRNN